MMVELTNKPFFFHLYFLSTNGKIKDIKYGQDQSIFQCPIPQSLRKVFLGIIPES